ncbi:MAG: Fe-S-containing protein [Methanosarcina sp.]
MNRKLAGMVLLVIAVSLLAAGCTESGSSTGSKDNAKSVKGTWITSQVNADQVSIPANSVNENTNVHFKVKTDIGELSVMAYRFDNKVFVRSNVCPPCNSIGFSLKNGTLVCDSCGTVFDAVTGKGIEGGCVAYPKESIPYTVSDGKITMKLSDVVAAHEKTIEPN